MQNVLEQANKPTEAPLLDEAHEMVPLEAGVRVRLIGMDPSVMVENPNTGVVHCVNNSQGMVIRYNKKNDRWKVALDILQPPR